MSKLLPWAATSGPFTRVNNPKINYSYCIVLFIFMIFLLKYQTPIHGTAIHFVSNKTTVLLISEKIHFTKFKLLFTLI